MWSVSPHSLPIFKNIVRLYFTKLYFKGCVLWMYYFDCEPDVSGQLCVLALSVQDVQGQQSLHWPGCCVFFFVRWRGRQALGCVPLREGGAVCWAQHWACLGISSFSLFCSLRADFTVLCFIHDWRLEAGFVQSINNNSSVEEAGTLALKVGGRFANADLTFTFFMHTWHMLSGADI